jgi:hypothetical protein
MIVPEQFRVKRAMGDIEIDVTSHGEHREKKQGWE